MKVVYKDKEYKVACRIDNKVTLVNEDGRTKTVHTDEVTEPIREYTVVEVNARGCVCCASRLLTKNEAVKFADSNNRNHCDDYGHKWFPIKLGYCSYINEVLDEDEL